ncbi:V-type ATP synthase subunit I [Haloplanus halophilus]|uniref:V-type ATP synthase subunit I n=1 Tax=Haloplanus halophilus TaxID=2949993 RepID=UPI00203AC727|nr:V-type ATP synthase subunit I [Haloplanus sp. GDY1]
MLRPERMSKVSVTGSKAVMDDVVEAVHDCNLLHVTEYDGSWEGFEPGNPIDGAEEASDKLVTVRSIESILDVDGEDAGPTRIVTEDALEDELEEIRERVNELEDRRDEIRSDLNEVEERLSAVEPFATLGIDLDLLSGYDTLDVVVGEGKADAVERAMADADGVDDVQVFAEDGVVAIFARPVEGADDVITDALVGVDFTALEVPDAEGSPEEYVADLEHRKQQLESKRRTVEDELEEVKLDAAGFLLAAEEKLSIDVQKREAPLSFATTDNAFVAEGWIPTDEYTGFAAAITDAVGDHAEVEELERAEFDSHGGEAHREDVSGSVEGGAAASTSADGGDEEVRADGGGVVMNDDDPPVIQNNPGLVKPFEVLTGAVSRPKYDEFDPTVILFLTFPAFFGFMIGDVGYGVIYTLIGYYLYTNFDSQAFKSMGGVTIFCGAFTILFGILYGEIFGTHQVSYLLWGGHAPLHKGLQPAYLTWAQAWLVISVLAGVMHLNVGWLFDFVENYQLHDVKHAVLESGSWLLMLNGLWVWVFSEHARNSKPGLLYSVWEAFGLGTGGLPPTVGVVGAVLFGLGLVLLIVGEPVEAIEFLNVFVNALSYTRIAAVLLAKAGMAFTVNLLFFGAYVDSEGAYHFIYGSHEGGAMFPGLLHMDPAAVMLPLGILVLVLGHLLVLALGVTSAGLQAVRLEYVEFFGKFYEGGGREYEPFGYERTYTTED